jgi:hypothetical protein
VLRQNAISGMQSNKFKGLCAILTRKPALFAEEGVFKLPQP